MRWEISLENRDSHVRALMRAEAHGKDSLLSLGKGGLGHVFFSPDHVPSDISLVSSLLLSLFS